jgi:hypothetical protein
MKDVNSKERLFRIMNQVNPEMNLNESTLSHGTDEDPVDDYNNEKPDQTDIIADEILSKNPKLKEIASNINKVYYTGIKEIGLIIKEGLKNYNIESNDEAASIIYSIFNSISLIKNPDDNALFDMMSQ